MNLGWQKSEHVMSNFAFLSVECKEVHDAASKAESVAILTTPCLDAQRLAKLSRGRMNVKSLKTEQKPAFSSFASELKT